MNKRWFVAILTIGLLLCLMPASALALSSDPIVDSDGNIIGWEDLSSDAWSVQDLTPESSLPAADAAAPATGSDPVQDTTVADSSATAENAIADTKPEQTAFVADLYADDPIPDLYAEPAGTPVEGTDDAENVDEPETAAVCRIGAVGYETLEAAVAAAQSGDQIDLAQDVTLEKGLSFEGKNLTISGGGMYRLTLNGIGIYAKNSDVTFADLDLVIQASTNPLGSGATANLFDLDTNIRLERCQLDLTTDGLNTSHGIYLYKGANLYMDATTATIHDFDTSGSSGIFADTSEMVDGQPSNEIQFTGGSDVTITGCSFNGMTVNPSDILVEGSTLRLDGNGVNGGRGGLGCYYGKLTLRGGTVTADSNTGRSWGIFVQGLDVDGSSTLSASSNAAFGIEVGGEGVIRSGAKVTLDGNTRDGLRVYAGSDYWYGDLTIESGAEVSACDNDGYGISNGYNLHILSGAVVTADRNATGGIHNGYHPDYVEQTVLTVDSGADLTVEENTGSGIYNKAGATLNLGAGSVRYNHSSGVGGGLLNEGTAALTDEVALYNNHALEAADDLYNEDAATLSFGATGSDWALDGAPDCEHDIDGWYDDSADARWNAHAEDRADWHLVLTDPATVTGVLTLKAAHGFHPTGSLVISKSITGKLKPEDSDIAFTFEIELEDDTVTTTEEKNYGDAVFENGKATFTLKGGESITLENLPAGVGYTVTELAQEGWTLAGINGDATGTVPSEETAEIGFVNEKVLVTGSLTISKSILGDLDLDDYDTAFTFELTLDDDTISTADAAEYGVQFQSGKATFTLKDSESITLTNLPAGIGYTVTEIGQKGWTLYNVSENFTGIIPENDTAAVAFLNMKDDNVDPVDPVFPIIPVIPEEPVVPDNPILPENPENPVSPATPDEFEEVAETPVLPEQPVNPPVQDATPDESVAHLPKTGTLDWFAPVLLLAGVALCAVGWYVRRRHSASRR